MISPSTCPVSGGCRGVAGSDGLLRSSARGRSNRGRHGAAGPHPRRQGRTRPRCLGDIGARDMARDARPRSARPG